MPLIPESLKLQMIENGRMNWDLSAKDLHTVDFKPVVKLFAPPGGATWRLFYAGLPGRDYGLD